MGDIDQRAIGVLPVDFSDGGSDLAEKIEADRLFVDRGTAGAVGILDAADHQFAVAFDPLVADDCQRVVVGRKREGGSDHASLGAGPD